MEHETQLKELLRIFLAENAKLNLSALRTEETCWVGNILDSMAFLEILSKIFPPSQTLPPQGEGSGKEYFQKKPIGKNVLHFARDMRKNPTSGEELLWQYLRFNGRGVRFRRQHPVAGRILDFYCHDAKLGIEVDGDIHKHSEIRKEDDQREKDLLELKNIFIIRFTNKEVLESAQNVVEKIEKILEERLQSPPPSGEGLGVGEKSLIDIGTGGGFPLLPIAISLPEWKCTGLDATRKKLGAISRMLNALHLNNVELVWGRAEEISRDKKYERSFDLVTSRAVAPLKKLLPWCAPFAKSTGHIVLWKSLTIDDELKDAEPVARGLGWQLSEKHEYTLPKDFGTRQLLVFKRNSTPRSL